jgi:hypothetical protein
MKNPRWGEGRRRRCGGESTNEGIRVFYPDQVCFIYKHVLMGLWSGMAQNIFLGFYSTSSKEELLYQ